METTMRSPLVRLLTTRRFAPLFVTQFLGAFNDNLLKSALAIFVTFRLADASGMPAATLVMVAGGLFIARSSSSPARPARSPTGWTRRRSRAGSRWRKSAS
jgi:hypothetical protein